ncbi:MAG: ABC transporter permease [Bacillota bacterium]
MKDIFRVAGWEIRKSLHSKMFIFMTFIFPILMLVLGFGAGLLSGISPGDGEVQIGVLDETGAIYERLKDREGETGYSLEKVAPGDRDYAQIAEDQDYSGVLMVPEDVFSGGETYFYSEDDSPEGLEEDISRVVSRLRLEDAGYSPDRIFELTGEVRLAKRALQEEEEEGLAGILVPYFMAILIALASIFSGSSLLQSITREKADRIAELLFSSLSAGSLMYGKILGYGALGLLQVTIWGGAGLLTAVLFFDLSLATFLEMKYIYMLLYFLLGYLMIASLNALLGAASSGDRSNNNSLSSVVAIIPIMPLWFSGLFFSQPEGLLSMLMSYIPLFTPVTMILRLGVSVPETHEILLTLLIVIVFDILLLVLAKKIFRAGMLLYGKKATPRNIIRVMRN